MSQEDKPVSEPRLVSYGLNMETCTLNLGGEEYYYDLKATTIDGDKPVAAQEPVGEMVGHHRVGAGEMPTIRWRDGYWPTIGTQFYANTEPCARCAELECDVAHWKANHDNRVEAARLLIDRQDLPLERVKAYQAHIALQAKITEQAARINALETELSLIKPNSDCDSGCMLSCSMEGKANAATIERQRKVIDDSKAALNRLLGSYRFQKPDGYPKSDSEKLADAVLSDIAELEKGVG